MAIITGACFINFLYMKYIYIACFVFLCSTLTVVSQEKTGVIRYGEIQSLGLGSPVGFDYNAVLYFNLKTALYITRKDSLDHLNANAHKTFNGVFSVSTNEKGFQYYTRLKDKKMYSRDIGFTYVKEDIPKIAWRITTDEKTIGDFTCQKATARFRGRDYTAWFTTAIPLPYGPWKLQGLPGVILEAYDTHKEIYWYFKNIQYPYNDDGKLKAIPLETGKNWVSFDTYKAFCLKSYKNSVIAGRMVVGELDINSYTPEMSGSYIEDFNVE